MKSEYLFDVLDHPVAAMLIHLDTAVAAATAYEYRLQALAAGAGAGPRTEAVLVSVPTAP